MPSQFWKTQLLSGLMLIVGCCAYAAEVPIYDFPIQAYSQDRSKHFPEDSVDYTKAVVSPEYQQEQLQQFYNHYYASDSKGLSPWSEAMVNAFLPEVTGLESNLLAEYDNQNKPETKKHYALNFKEQTAAWWQSLRDNMGVETWNDSHYQEKNRAITVRNTLARALPDNAPDFNHFTLPGEGFPFDNLQESALWVGTPLYVIHVTQDRAWSLVLTPDCYVAWIKSEDLAYASSDFISKWQQAAHKGLMAITKTKVSVHNDHRSFQFTAYIGSVFPLAYFSEETTGLYIPVANAHHQAQLALGILPSQAATRMPLPLTKKNMSGIMQQLQGRPYGWGGTSFLNDCSQEMKSLFTPFGIWLPRNSWRQGQYGSTVDLSQKSLDDRLNILKTAGHPLMTLVFTGGHIMLYVGNEELPNQGLVAMTYQNVWALGPKNWDKRFVVGQSAFLPLLTSYPENSAITSPADQDVFKLVYLDALSSDRLSPREFASRMVKTH